MSALDDWLARRRDDIAAELADWVAIPSVDGQPEHERDLDRSAQWLTDTLLELGFSPVETHGSPPLVFAELRSVPHAPTVLVYSHHDVRVAAPEGWASPPFEPVRCGRRLYGRGSSDAKGQVLAHLWALRALLANGHGAPPVNLVLLIDGEEETGSPHLDRLLSDLGDRVRADLVVLSDTMTWSSDRPAVCTGMRGMTKATLEIRGAGQDVHAGAVAGAATNAAGELVRVLARLHDDSGAVAVPGFYAEVREPDDAADLAALGPQSDWLQRTSVRAVAGETDRSLGELLFARPAIEVISLDAGDAAPPTSGTMPATARASLQISLAADQDPTRVTDRLRDWLATQVGAEYEHALTVQDTIAQPPYVTPRDLPELALLREAMAAAWQRPIGWMRNSGGAPAVLLAERAGAPVVFFGTGLPEDNWHGADESVDLEVLITGAAALARFWASIAQQ